MRGRQCGTRSSYQGGCRCKDCLGAEAAYKRELRAANLAKLPFDAMPVPSLKGFAVMRGDALGVVPGFMEDPRRMCRGVDPALFFPDQGENGAAAKALCAGCPALTECRQWGIDHERYGIWGGLSEKQRHDIRSKTAA